MWPLRHRSIVQLVGICDDDEEHCGLLLELVTGGSLRDHLNARGSGDEMQRILDIGQQVLHALHYLHNNGVLHLDLKCDNILLAEHGRVKVTDFGTSKIRRETMMYLTQVPGTPAFMAPETLSSTPLLTEKADVYSFGMVLYEMCTGRLPFEGLDPYQVMAAVHDGETPNLDDDIVSDDLASLMRECWTTDPEVRPSVTVLLTAMEAISHGLRMTCTFCVDDYLPSQVVYCSSNEHFVCMDCIPDILSQCMRSGSVREDSTLPCPLDSTKEDECTISYGSIMANVDAKMVMTWNEAVQRVIESRINGEHTRELDRARGEAAHLGIVAMAQSRLKALFNVVCPKQECRKPVAYESGCFALTCESCETPFCAYCWAIHPDSLSCHNHVSHCQYNPHAPSIFGYPEPQLVFREATRQRLIREIKTLFEEAIPRDFHAQVKEAVKSDFRDWDIKI